MLNKRDIGTGAELYRGYNVWCNEVERENDGDEYLFDSEDRLDKIKEYYSRDNIKINNIDEIGDYLTYTLDVKNTVLDDLHIYIGCLSLDSELEIEELSEVLSEKILEVAEFVETITPLIADNTLVLKIG